jgi:uncharacterized integral membrane protein
VGETEQGRQGQPERQHLRLRYGLIGLVGLVGLIFIGQNSGPTRIHLLWFDFEFPLIFVLVGMVLLGAGVDRALVWRGRRERP